MDMGLRLARHAEFCTAGPGLPMLEISRLPTAVRSPGLTCCGKRRQSPGLGKCFRANRDGSCNMNSRAAAALNAEAVRTLS